ncbi:MAG: MotA/TolQ/ExbB proton channel family protein [Candidatus Sericytochromatia bacterium]|nr:MotA/TolQ/ExbB proton channel family protein [Candidatus Sericytochromatia bacterium]
MTLLNLIRAGGWTMVPIILASFVTVALIIDHAWSLSRAKKHLYWLWQFPDKKDQLLLKKPSDLVLQFLTEVEEAQVRDLGEKTALAGQLVLAQERRISWLGTIASIAPLLGLIGTVSGMILIFNQISAAPPANPMAELSRGISEALVATAGGLIVAIVAALSHHSLQSSNDDLAVDLEAWLKETTAPASAASGGVPLAHANK